MIPLRAYLEAGERLLSTRDDVLATGVGHRIRGGARVGGLCLNAYVASKRASVPKARRLPRTVKVSPGVRIPVDVQKHHLSENQSPGSAIRDRRTQGCLGAYFRSGGALFGLTAGHCILGEDGELETVDPVRIYHGGAWKPLGFSSSGVYEPDPGPGRSVRDHGFVRVADPSLPGALESVPVWRRRLEDDLLSLVGRPVFSVSYLSGRVEAVVHNVCYREPLLSGDSIVDVMLHSSRALSRRGDSGKLWRLASGEALALHFRGNVFPRRPGSTKAFACFLYKIQSLNRLLV